MNLSEYLADKFPDPEKASSYGQRAVVRMALVKFSTVPIDMWLNLLHEATRQSKLHDVLAALKSDYPEDEVIDAAINGQLTDVSSDRKMVDSNWVLPTNDSHEKLMAERSTLLPVAFLEQGLQAARSVAKVSVRQSGKSWTGTGFLIAGGLFVTNNHVLPDASAAEGAQFLFNYEVTRMGRIDAEVESCEPRNFWTSKEHDCTIVKLKGSVTERWGLLSLASTLPDRFTSANIIQHPRGRPKELGLSRNYIVYADEHRVQYLTDTEPGSSGSPVFDDHWRVVAVHHSGGWITEPRSFRRNYRNEGISSQQVSYCLAERGNI